MRRLSIAGWLLVVLGVGVILGLLWLVVVVAPPLFVDGSSVARLKAQNEVRTTLLQGLAGIVLGVGAYFTYRQLHIAREQQITERYTRAIDQLGHQQLNIRLGGIYALERIARDSRADRPTIGEVLTAFVRTRAAALNRAVDDELPELQISAPDVQASLSVLGRGGFAHREPATDRLDLHAVDLRHANLREAHLEGVSFRDGNLASANLVHANLEGADLVQANVEGAALDEANLEGAILGYANLEGAALGRANLKEATLGYANLKEATLGEANLKEANLFEANLTGATLIDANLTGATLDSANLTGAKLGRANLKGATLGEATLTGATLGGANLKEAHLFDANLTGANLDGADLEGALLVGANLTGAKLDRANLEGAVLVEAKLEGAVATGDTNWPSEFDWRRAGVIVMGQDSTPSPP